MIDLPHAGIVRRRWRPQTATRGCSAPRRRCASASPAAAPTSPPFPERGGRPGAQRDDQPLRLRRAAPRATTARSRSSARLRHRRLDSRSTSRASRRRRSTWSRRRSASSPPSRATASTSSCTRTRRPGSGLGSSSAVVVTLIGLLKEYHRLPLTDYEIAELAYTLEREDLGIKGGLQDQYAATFGGFNFIELPAPTDVIVNPLRIADDVDPRARAQHAALLHGPHPRRPTTSSTTRPAATERGDEDAVDGPADAEGARRRDEGRAAAAPPRRLRRAARTSAWEHKKQMSPRITNDLIDEALRRGDARPARSAARSPARAAAATCSSTAPSTASTGCGGADRASAPRSRRLRVRPRRADHLERIAMTDQRRRRARRDAASARRIAVAEATASTGELRRTRSRPSPRRSSRPARRRQAAALRQRRQRRRRDAPRRRVRRPLPARPRSRCRRCR